MLKVEAVSKHFGGLIALSEVSLDLRPGEIHGLIGPNGSGKTTLLRLLLGELPPDAGEVRHGANLQVAYYDQLREQLDPDRSVADTIGDGRETVTINGREQHVHGYLRDFLFPPERAQSPVRALSGGERNRLLLARLFTRPANVLVLDEPTRGIDVSSKAQIYALIDALVATSARPAPKAVLLVSSYLPELLGVCDRVAVMFRGRLQEARPVADLVESDLMVATMTGGAGRA